MAVTAIPMECQDCAGEGRNICYGIVYEPGCNHPHYGDVDRGPCHACDGTGTLDMEIETRDLGDLEQEDFDMLEAGASR